jgi:transposase-like protein
MMMRRNFSREFKLDVCQKIVSGEVSKSRTCREHSLSGSVLERWLEQYRLQGESAFQGQVWRSSIQTPDARIKELEASLGRAHLELEFMKEAMGKLTPRSRSEGS